jgi:putative restriction endonuclease
MAIDPRSIRAAIVIASRHGAQDWGAIPGYPPGSHFASRRELFDVGIHRQLQAGIVGSDTEGAESIVLSGGYEDDEDYSNVIIYTGEWGRDAQTGKQIADQVLSHGNRALALNQIHGPNRARRGASVLLTYQC